MIQELVGPDGLATWDTALKTVGALAMIYMGRGYWKMQEEMTKWRVYLFGINNDNGLNGNVSLLMKEREERMIGNAHLHKRESDD